MLEVDVEVEAATDELVVDPVVVVVFETPVVLLVLLPSRRTRGTVTPAAITITAAAAHADPESEAALLGRRAVTAVAGGTIATPPGLPAL